MYVYSVCVFMYIRVSVWVCTRVYLCMHGCVDQYEGTFLFAYMCM